jgi:hypothetical protein
VCLRTLLTIFESFIFDCDEIDYVGCEDTYSKVDKEQDNAQWEIIVVDIEKEAGQKKKKGDDLNKQWAKQWIS